MLKIRTFLFLLFAVTLSAQTNLPDDSEISVLTIGPGTYLNDSFGHSAFRVKSDRFDYIFNYGVFDFNEPNFYLNFAQGKLNYRLDISTYQNFYANYVAQNRWIKEQILNLNSEEKQALFNFLMTNAKPENQYYLYEFFFDNCATKIKDVLQIVFDNSIIFNTPEDFNPESFRALIHSHVNRNSWGSFGIDIALGSVIDRKATPEEHMFLPIYIYDFFENAAKVDGTQLVKTSQTLFNNKESKISNNFFISPLFIFGLLGLLILFLTYRDIKNKSRTKWLDIAIFGITGLIGIVLLLLWFATDHTATAFNYNLLWAFPLNLFVIGQLFKSHTKVWFRKYVKLLVILLCLLTLHWLIGVQVFAIGLIPLLTALVIRYLFLINYLKK